MSQVGKLWYVDSKLGAPTSGQQTTRILFNTIEAPGTTSSLSFFKNFQGLTNGQTNLTQNKLDSMESMVIKTIWLAQFTTAGESVQMNYAPRHQVFMEGAGILIPPQVQWYVDYRIFNVVTGATIAATDNTALGCYLFGTRVLLNFNTSI